MADKINTLPDAVLCHILSFLPTKKAFSTGILSKRWTHLWRSVPTLDFSLSDHNVHWELWLQLPYRFNDFVYSVLLLRDAMQPIRRFCLTIELEDEVYDFSHVDRWIRVVLQKKVEHLDLHMSFAYQRPNLPVSIINCTTLVVLKLNGFSVNDFSSVGLTSLKILHLRHIEFAEVRYLMLLLAGCPILEYLQTDDIITLDSGEPLTDYREFKSLSLTKLTRADIDYCNSHLLLKALDNVEFLRIEIDKVCHNFDDIPSFHNLSHLELSFCKYNWHLLVEMLKHCPKLQNLVLDEEDMDKKDDQENWADPKFVLECLSLHLRTCTLRNYGGLQGELLFSKYIMKNARVLQTMTIKSTPSIQEEELQMIKKKLSSCPRSSATCQLSVD